MKKLIYVFMTTVIFISCKKKNEEPLVNIGSPDTGYLHGTFVINEGSFMNNNSSISYINSSDVIINDIYLQANEFELGDVLQSFTVIGERGYAVLNNSQKIEVIDMKTMHYHSTITGLDYPRHLLDVGNGKAYITNGSLAGEVKVINLSDQALVSSIAVGNGPEKMLLKGNYVYVCNSGGWDLDSTVSVIDISTNTLATTIRVGDRPMDITSDHNGNIWVICSGNESWMAGGETAPSCYKINGISNLVSDSILFNVIGGRPKNIASSPSGATIYFDNGGVSTLEVDAIPIALSSILNSDVGSLDIHPVSGDIWTSTVSDFTNPSTVKQYTSSGVLKATFQTGIGTNGVVFN